MFKEKGYYQLSQLSAFYIFNYFPHFLKAIKDLQMLLFGLF